MSADRSEFGSSARLSVRKLRKHYGSFVAVRDLDLEVRGGEFVALLGPSGCGKTTMLRSIAGLVTPTSGEILVDDASIVSVPVHRRQLGMMFQSYALFPHMTIADNIAFGLKMRRVPKAEIGRRVADALALVRLADLGGRFPHQLSGGQQQRVALARALVVNPRVLLLDEPLGALDAKLREEMQVELRQLQQRIGVTTIFVTHDQQEALAMADRIAVMRGGVLEQFDTPQTLYDRPATPFVAGFIGQINQLAARLQAVEGEWAVAVADGDGCRLRAPATAGLAAGGTVTLMVRPERVRIRARSDADAQDDPRCNRLEGRVVTAVFGGERTLCRVETPLGTVSSTVQNGGGSGGGALASGAGVVLSWHPEDTLVFPAASTP